MPLSVYHLMSGEVSTATGTPMEDFFDEANIVAEAMAFASAITQGALTDDILEDPKVAAGIAMPMAFAFATPVAPAPIGPSNFPSLVLSLFFIVRFIPSLCLFLMDSCSISYFFRGLIPVKVDLSSQFKVGSSSTSVLDLVSKATTFFI